MAGYNPKKIRAIKAKPANKRSHKEHKTMKRYNKSRKAFAKWLGM